MLGNEKAPGLSQRGWLNYSEVPVERDPLFERLVPNRLRYGATIEGDQKLKSHPLASHLKELLPFDVGEPSVVTEEERYKIVRFIQRDLDFFSG